MDTATIAKICYETDRLIGNTQLEGKNFRGWATLTLPEQQVHIDNTQRLIDSIPDEKKLTASDSIEYRRSSVTRLITLTLVTQ